MPKSEKLKRPVAVEAQINLGTGIVYNIAENAQHFVVHPHGVEVMFEADNSILYPWHAVDYVRYQPMV